MVDHWPRWAHFVRAELAVGGPDCQLHLLLSLLPDDASPIEKVWLCGCYGAHHCVPSAYAVWKQWRPEEYPDEFRRGCTDDWLKRHWNALPVRPEMRSHRMVEKRDECLRDFALYAVQEAWNDPKLDYDGLWDDSQAHVKYYGRYMAIKFLELLRRTVRPDVRLYDVRARNAWSPRITLGMLFPEHAAIVADRENNSEEAIKLAEHCAAETLKRLFFQYGLEVSYFQLQVLLCNYREAFSGTFYPGAGHDEEMDYIDKATSDFDMQHLYDTRARVFDHQYLGEFGNWHGLRKDKYREWKELLNSDVFDRQT